MTTLSGSSNYENTRNEIISAALRKCGQLAEGETATAQQVADAAGDLERFVKALQADGVHIWKTEELVLFLDTTSQSYDLGSTGDRVCRAAVLDTTTIGADEAAGQTSLTVASITGIANADTIGIVLDDGTMHWTTVNGAPSGTTVVVTSALPSAAASGKSVYAFPSKAVRPLRILSARVKTDSTNENPMALMGREDYFDISNKSSTGVPSQFFYNPTLTDGKFYIYPVASDATDYINLTAAMPFDDFDSADNNPDLPAEWTNALIWGLASEIAIEYGVDDSTYIKIQEKAAYWLDKASQMNTEDASVIFMPNFD